MNCCTSWDREDDPKLHDFYAMKLLEPGWAGDLDHCELAYIKSQLQLSPSLKRKWGFRPSAKRVSGALIRAVAMYGCLRDKSRVLALPPGGHRAFSMGKVEKW